MKIIKTFYNTFFKADDSDLVQVSFSLEVDIHKKLVLHSDRTGIKELYQFKRQFFLYKRMEKELIRRRRHAPEPTFFNFLANANLNDIDYVLKNIVPSFLRDIVRNKLGYGGRALNLAIDQNNIALFDYFISKSVDINSNALDFTQEDMNPLTYACFKHQYDMVRHILTKYKDTVNLHYIHLFKKEKRHNLKAPLFGLTTGNEISPVNLSKSSEFLDLFLQTPEDFFKSVIFYNKHKSDNVFQNCSDLNVFQYLLDKSLGVYRKYPESNMIELINQSLITRKNEAKEKNIDNDMHSWKHTVMEHFILTAQLPEKPNKKKKEKI